LRRDSSEAKKAFGHQRKEQKKWQKHDGREKSEVLRKEKQEKALIWDNIVMKRILILLLVLATYLAVVARGAEVNQKSSAEQKAETHPWIGKYPMSFFTLTRSAETVGKDHLSVSLKFQHFDWTRVRSADGTYHARPSGQQTRKTKFVTCTKYGWAEDHHLAIGVPILFNDFDIPGNSNHSQGPGNIFLFEKWNIIKETNNFPGIAIDFWYYLPTGDSKRKLDSDDGAYKISTEISKAWEGFSLHFNPNYKWSEDKDAEVGEINAAFLLKAYPNLWPAIEYNYVDEEKKNGHRHDLVPGVIWKFKEGWSFKAGIPINLDSTFTDRDRVGLVLKLFYRW